MSYKIVALVFQAVYKPTGKAFQEENTLVLGVSSGQDLALRSRLQPWWPAPPRWGSPCPVVLENWPGCRQDSSSTDANGECKEVPGISRWFLPWCPIRFFLFTEFCPRLHWEYLFSEVTYSVVSHIFIFNNRNHSTGILALPELIFSVKQADIFLFSLLNPNKSP